MLGDILISRLNEVKQSKDKRSGNDAFCEVIKRIAIDEINAIYPKKIDSDIIVEVYYNILLNNLDYIPASLKKLSPSNGQYRFRIAVRNIFTSNSDHSNGLSNNSKLHTVKIVNDARKGKHYTYQGVKNDN